MIARSVGSKILSSSDVVVSDAPVRIGDNVASSSRDIEPSSSRETNSPGPDVSVDQDAQGNVTRIHVRCGCGEQITLACDYDDAAASGTHAVRSS